MATKKLLEVKDDIVDYYLYPKLDLHNYEQKLHAVSTILQSVKKEAGELFEDYIWHNDVPEFMLQSCDTPVCINGFLNYGENIEDEWFLVHVLMKLTMKFQDLIVRVKDPDGEFLLIEAAEYLPSWVTPETCENKVFLYQGHMHILPRSYSCDDDDEFLITDSVLDYIRKSPEESRVKPIVEMPIFQRISDYPQKVDTLIHESVVYVPVAVAALLNHDPTLITAAVRAFYYRDIIDLRACRAMKYFPPEERVLYRARFTKCSYAMLMSSKFQPDKRTGWNLPSPSDPAYKAHLLGIKLACGFEILLTQAKGRKTSDSADDLSLDEGWIKFKTSLDSINYFRDLLECSKDYNQLLNGAQCFYRSWCQNKEKKSPSSRVADMLPSIDIDIDLLRKAEAQINLTAEDDSWMDITKEDLDAMLQARFGNSSDLVDIPNGHSKDISQHLNSFINHVSGIDGVEFPSKKAPQRPKRGVKSKKKKNVQFSADTKLHSVTSTDEITSKDNSVTIEPDGFMNAVQNILNFAIPDDDNYWESDGSGMSSYEDEDEIDLGGPSNQNKDKSGRDEKMVAYMAEMDKELSKTSLGKSFVQKKSTASTSKKEASQDDTDDFDPVDIDLNALKNIIMSYKTQMGESGPVENILGPMGINLEDIDADVD